MATLNMHRPTCLSISEDETTRAIFIVRVVFNYFTLPGYHFLQLRHAYVSNDTPIDSMLGKFILTSLDLYTDFLDHCHD